MHVDASRDVILHLREDRILLRGPELIGVVGGLRTR
jgi:hypothetical protein